MNSRSSDADNGGTSTTAEDTSLHHHHHHHHDDEDPAGVQSSSPIISRDLRQAIELLRSLPAVVGPRSQVGFL